MTLPISHSVARAARLALLLLAVVVIIGLSAAQAATFKTQRAINIAQWFTWPRYEASGAGIAWPPYKKDPRPPSIEELQALHQAGFDTVRLPVDPAPFMVFQSTRRDAVFKMLFAAIEDIQAAGLKVIVDLHPNSKHAVWGQHAIVSGIESPTFTAYANAVEDMARSLLRYDPQSVALELINEPRLKCKGAEQDLWQQMLKVLVDRARAGNPGLTLIGTGSCISTPDGLIALDAKALGDSNLIYTFHYYEPFTFTHQGAKFIPWPDKYLDGVPWPAGKRPISEPLALLAKNIQTTTDLSGNARATALAGARINLKKFYDSGAGPDLVEERFVAVADWAAQNGIPAENIFIGEFGVLRQQPDAPGARCADRIRWLADVRAAAERHDFSWAYFNYDGPFSLLIDDDTRELDPVVLASLGLADGGSGSCQDMQ